MVPISPTPEETFERIETNLKYLIDLDLSDDYIWSDPLALAFYYRFSENTAMQNINRATLTAWARMYCYSRLAIKEFSKKKDTETTAAILAYSTLKRDRGYPEDKKQEIELNIKIILEAEIGKDNLYFGRPNFTVIILRAANEAGIPIREEERILGKAISCYSNSNILNNLIGLPFLTELLIEKKEQRALGEIVETARKKLKDHLTEYDDRLYIISTLWKCHKAENTLTEIKTDTESAILETPITVSDIINKGDISDITIHNDNLKISRLYKAVLFDLLTEYKNNETELREKEIDKKYSGDSVLKWGAFLTFSLIPFIITGVIGFLFKDRVKEGLSFWLLQKTETKIGLLAIDTILLIAVLYLTTTSIMGIYSLYISLIKKKIIKDLRVWDYYKAHQLKATKWFVKTVILGTIIGILIRLFGASTQKYLTGKG